MTRMVIAIAGERNVDENGVGGWSVHRYSYVDDLQEGERLKDAKFVERLIARLMSTEWQCNERPPETMKRFFDVYVEVSNHGREDAKYRIDYRRYAGCPSQVVDDGMEIYAAIKKYGIRPANKQVEAKNEWEKRRREELAAMARFVVGERYFGERVDEFGHIERVEVVWDGRKASKVRMFENGNEYVKFGNGLLLKAENRVVQG